MCIQAFLLATTSFQSKVRLATAHNKIVTILSLPHDEKYEDLDFIKSFTQKWQPIQRLKTSKEPKRFACPNDPGQGFYTVEVWGSQLSKQSNNWPFKTPCHQQKQKMTKLHKLLISNLKSLINKYWKWGHKPGKTAALPGFNTDSD